MDPRMDGPTEPEEQDHHPECPEHPDVVGREGVDFAGGCRCRQLRRRDREDAGYEKADQDYKISKGE